MRTTIKLEMIGFGKGKDQAEKCLGWNTERPFVASVTGFSNYEFDKVYIRGYLDYSNANSVGSRGVYKLYFLDDGLYEVNERTSWKRFSHYFLLIENGKQTTMNVEQAVEWLTRNISE